MSTLAGFDAWLTTPPRGYFGEDYCEPDEDQIERAAQDWLTDPVAIAESISETEIPQLGFLLDVLAESPTLRQHVRDFYAAAISARADQIAESDAESDAAEAALSRAGY